MTHLGNDKRTEAQRAEHERQQMQRRIANLQRELNKSHQRVADLEQDLVLHMARARFAAATARDLLDDNAVDESHREAVEAVYEQQDGSHSPRATGRMLRGLFNVPVDEPMSIAMLLGSPGRTVVVRIRGGAGEEAERADLKREHG